MKFPISEYLEFVYSELINSEQRPISITRSWASQFPNKPAVYIFRIDNKIIYVGETGSIRGRMKDLIDTRNHVIRRSIGIKLFSLRETFTKPSASLKFNDDIERELNFYITEKLKFSFITIELGRKELEEMIFLSHSPEFNNKGKRKTF